MSKTLILCCPVQFSEYQIPFVSALGGAGICVALVGQIGCEHRYVAVGVLCLCTALLSANRAGYLSNHLDLAPR